ncbi:transmembrane protein [Cryptosporidium bovis]|uniref:uncharacterized protein n=1 Tax=Cryptosporidium bovis TaxID=310047 RepID=UPI00351A03DA|nr:transmembrane protein [Cryptosporidium bovis]
MIILFFFFFLLNGHICLPEQEIESTDGIDPDLFDNSFSKKEQELKMSVCLGLTQSDFVKERIVYQRMAESIKKDNKIHFNDALKSLFHQRLVTCYFNSKIQDVNSFLNGSITENDLTRIFSVNNEIPNKFSKKQLSMLEKVIASNFDRFKEEPNKTSSLVKLFTLIFIVSTIGISFYFALNKLKLETTKRKHRKKK